MLFQMDPSKRVVHVYLLIWVAKLETSHALQKTKLIGVAEIAYQCLYPSTNYLFIGWAVCDGANSSYNTASVTRFGDLLDFGQNLNAYGNN